MQPTKPQSTTASQAESHTAIAGTASTAGTAKGLQHNRVFPLVGQKLGAVVGFETVVIHTGKPVPIHGPFVPTHVQVVGRWRPVATSAGGLLH